MLLDPDRLIDLAWMAELAPGTVFAGHRIEDVAGRGGMGVVYRATQLALDRSVALKVIAPGLLEDQTVRQRFVRESKIAASIDHPNVIPIYYAGTERGVAYIAMRYVAGDDVRSLVRREGPLAPARAARIVAQIGAALDAAHAAGLVHRDIKPANVLLGPDDHVYLTDFGLTKHALSIAGSTKPGHWVGTLDYVAPEQIRGDRVDARADVYALGCLLFFALTGHVPFEREGDEARLWAHISEPPPQPSERVAGLPAAFDEMIARALAKDPDERFPSAGDLGRAALAAAAGERPPQRERLVATGAAAPIESETVSAAARPAGLAPAADSQAETAVQERSRAGGAWRRLLLGGALLAVVAVVVIALVLGVGGGGGAETAATPTPTATPTATPRATPVATPTPRVVDSLTVGNRPNVVREAAGNVFVGSFKSSRLTILSARTGKRRSFAPTIGVGASDSAFGFGSVWFVAARARKVWRLNPENGHPQAELDVDGAPAAIALSSSAVWIALRSGDGAPDMLEKLDPKTGAVLLRTSIPWGVAKLAISPNTVWVLNRRRSRVQKIDAGDGAVERSLAVGHSNGQDIEYADGAVWAAYPDDNTVYEIRTATGSVIPISVGQAPRQLTVDGDRVYVTDYNSSNLYTIDARSSRVIGAPVDLPINPYAIDTGAGAIWVTSPSENALTKLVTGSAG